MAAQRGIEAHTAARYCIFWDADNCAFNVSAMDKIQRDLYPAYLVSVDVFASGPMAEQLIKPACNESRPPGGVLHVDISTRHQPKSLTDQRLTLTAIEKADALAGANHAHTTTAFVIVSNDKDFIPLHSELRRRGLQPVAAGYTATFSAEVRAVAAHTIMLPSPASAAAPKAPYAAPRPHAITLPASRGKLLCALAQENAHAEAAAAPPETQDSFEYALAELQSCTQELAGALGETILGPSEPAPSLRAKSWVDVATSEAHGASERSQPGNSCANSKLAWAELLEDVSKGVTAAQAARAAAVQEMSAAAACTELSAKLQCCSALSFNGLWHAVCADLPHLAELRHEQGVTFKHFIIGGLVGLRDGWTDVDRQKLVELLLLGPRNAKSCLHWLDGAFPAQIGKRLVGKWPKAADETWTTEEMHKACRNAKYLALGRIHLLAVRVALS